MFGQITHKKRLNFCVVLKSCFSYHNASSDMNTSSELGASNTQYIGIALTFFQVAECVKHQMVHVAITY